MANSLYDCICRRLLITGLFGMNLDYKTCFAGNPGFSDL